MSRKPTLKEVAKQAGVSIGTVSRVINRHANVAPEIRQRVEKAISALGYKPNVLAQSMRGGASRMVGVIVRDISLPMFAGFVNAAQEALMEADYTLLLACSRDSKERELDLLSLFARRGVDGLVMTSCDEGDAELQQAREEVGAPIVMLDRMVSDQNADAILLAHKEGVSSAIKYLSDLGHKRIGLITGPKTVHSARDRINGYRQAYKDLGLKLDESLLCARSFDSENAFIEVSAMLGEKNPPTALIAGGVDILSGALRAIRGRGLRIPEDVSVVGGGDSDLAKLTTPAMTIIRWNYDHLGRVGAQLLLDRIRAKTASEALTPRKVVLPMELVIRASCAPPA